MHGCGEPFSESRGLPMPGHGAPAAPAFIRVLNEELKMASLLQYTCPCCGGKLEFDSDVQKPKCPYCDTEFEMEALEAVDDELKGEKADSMEWQTPNETWAEQQNGEEDVKIYVCDSCGGEVMADKTAAAMRCPWCDSPIVMKGNVAGSLRPDWVIPFKLDKEAAKEKFKEHLTGKKFLPDVFADENHIDEIRGVYVPFWLFDADTTSEFQFRGTKVSHWSSGSYAYTKTSHYALQRKGNLGFAKVPVDGSKKMPDDLSESVEPYQTGELTDFHTAYLSGFLADRYDVSAEESQKRANTRIRKSVEDAFRATTGGYGSVIVKSSNVQVNNGQAKYALLPVWILNTTWNGEKFVFAMNGQTGKFVGNLPLDIKKRNKYFWKWFLILSGSFLAALILLFILLGL